MPTKNILLVRSLINGNFLFNKSLPVIKRTMRAKSTKNKAMASAPPAKYTIIVAITVCLLYWSTHSSEAQLVCPPNGCSASIPTYMM